MMKNSKIKIPAGLSNKNSFSFRLFIIIALFLFQSLFSAAQSKDVLPLPKGYVSDYADIFLGGDKFAIETYGEELKAKTGAEIALLTVKTIEPYASIEEFAEAVFQKWGIGEKGKDNGVLIVLSTTERSLRIEVGYGLEGAITDGQTGYIMDTYMIPFFIQNDFATGLQEGYKAVAGIVAKEYNIELTGLSSQYYKWNYDEGNKGSGLSDLLSIIIFLIIFFLSGGRFLWLLPFFLSSGKRKGGFGSGFGSGYSGGSRGFSGGSFGGGFGGFGGGSSGGGGASRRF